MTDKTKGYLYAMLSSCTFGSIPLFSMPALASGMLTQSVLAYRFLFACVAMGAIMAVKHYGFKITFGEFLRISVLSLLYDASAILLIYGYKYMPSGIATTLLFSYPVFTELIMLSFFHEKLSLRVVIAIALAVGGVVCLSNISGSGEHGFSVLGLVIELLAGLTYALYLVFVPVLKVRNLESTKLNFYVFFLGMVYMAIFALFTGGIQPIGNGLSLLSLIMLGLLPTALSNITLVLAIKRIGSTLTAVLGALEPLTAMTIGICAFGEPLTAVVAIGFFLIIASVMLLVTKKE